MHVQQGGISLGMWHPKSSKDCLLVFSFCCSDRATAATAHVHTLARNRWENVISLNACVLLSDGISAQQPHLRFWALLSLGSRRSYVVLFSNQSSHAIRCCIATNRGRILRTAEPRKTVLALYSELPGKFRANSSHAFRWSWCNKICIIYPAWAAKREV